MDRRLALIGVATLLLTGLGLTAPPVPQKPAAAPMVVYKSPT